MPISFDDVVAACADREADARPEGETGDPDRQPRRVRPQEVQRPRARRPPRRRRRRSFRRCADAAKVEAQRRDAARRPAPSRRGRRRCCSSSRRRADADDRRPPPPRPSSPRAGCPRGGRARRELKLDRTATARRTCRARLSPTLRAATHSNARGVGRRLTIRTGTRDSAQPLAAVAPNAAAAVPPDPPRRRVPCAPIIKLLVDGRLSLQPACQPPRRPFSDGFSAQTAGFAASPRSIAVTAPPSGRNPTR